LCEQGLIANTQQPSSRPRKEFIMNRDLARQAGAYRLGHGRIGPAPFEPRAPSRRQFLRTAGGALAAGAALGYGLGRPERAVANPGAEPVPIPGGTPVLGGAFHVFGPGLVDPIDAEPSTITDFIGFIGLAFLDGTVRRTNRVTGEVRTLPFVDTHMAFMKGLYRGTDGRFHRGAFAFI
jgi:hypothetical protein